MIICGLHIVDVCVIVAYLLLVVSVGLWTSRKVHKQGDFYVGGRRFGKFLIMMQGFGAGTSNTHPVLVSGAVYKFGMAGIWYSWLYMLFTPIRWILQPILRRMRVYTIADFFKLRYGKFLEPFYALSALLITSIMIGTILLAMGQVVEGVTEGAVSKNLTVVICALIFVSYGAAGGLIAAAYTDALQGIFTVVLSFMLLPPLFVAVGGFSGLHAKLPASAFSLAMPHGAGSVAENITLFAVFMLFVNGILGNVVEPMSAQTNNSSKDERTLRIGGLAGGFMKRICTVAWALVGLCALVLWPDLSNGELSFGLAAKQFLPLGLSGLMIACMMAAAMSTCDTAMVAGSAIFSRNLYAPYIRRGKSDHHYLTVARIAGILVALSGIIVAYAFGDVKSAVVWWWKVTAFLGPAYILGMFFRRGNSWGAWACIISSCIAWQLTEHLLVPLDPKWGVLWYQAAIYIPTGVFFYFLVSYLTPPEDEQKLNRVFARFQTPVGQEQKLVEMGLEDSIDDIASIPVDAEEKS
jgi:Na+/proline symporter